MDKKSSPHRAGLRPVLLGAAGPLLLLLLLGWSAWSPTGPSTLLAGSPRIVKRMQTNFTVDDLRAAARLTGQLNCTGALSKTGAEIEAAAPAPDVMLTAAKVACAAPEVDSNPPGSPYDHCCQRTVYIRPNTTDFKVFHGVIANNGFHFLYNLPPLKELPPRYILDAGGNVGFSALQFSLLYPSATIITLEPNPENFAQLSKNVAGRKNVIPLNVGLWGKSTHVTVVEKRGEYGYVFQEVPPEQGGIPAMSVVDIMKRFNVPHFDIVKIDIEGAEVSVFAPDADLSWMRPSSNQIITIEVHWFFAHHFNVKYEEMRARVDRATAGYVHRHDGGELDLYFGRALVD